MPREPTRKPVTQKQAEVNIAARGPLRSTQVPNRAADRPSITIAIEKMMPIAVRLDSKWATSAALYTLVAYAWPMHRCTASAAGGISQRLKPGRATVRSRARKLGTATKPTSVDSGRDRLGRYDRRKVLARSTADRHLSVTRDVGGRTSGRRL